MFRNDAVRVASLAMLCVLLAAGCGSDSGSCDYTLGSESGCAGGTLTVEVVAAGTGNGEVNGDGISCNLSEGAHTGDCSQAYPLTGPGNVLLTAIASSGSVFAGWSSGCSRILGAGGTLCYIDYSGVATYTSTVTATFNLAGTTSSVTLYNNASVAANLVGPGETAGVANLVQPHGQREVTIVTTVGSLSEFRAYLNPATLTVSTTCSVTATAWQNGTHPLVMFDNTDGNRLVCSEGLVGL